MELLWTFVVLPQSFYYGPYGGTGMVTVSCAYQSYKSFYYFVMKPLRSKLRNRSTFANMASQLCPKSDTEAVDESKDAMFTSMGKPIDNLIKLQKLFIPGIKVQQHFL